jgi:transposase
VVASHGMSMCLGCSANQDTYLSAQFRRVAARRGSKRAVIAVARSIVIIGYYLQKSQRNYGNYEDLGGDYFDRMDSDGLKRYFVRRLEKLTHKVTLVPIKAA